MKKLIATSLMAAFLLVGCSDPSLPDPAATPFPKPPEQLMEPPRKMQPIT